MRISDWSSDVCSSDLRFRLQPFGTGDADRTDNALHRSFWCGRRWGPCNCGAALLSPDGRGANKTRTDRKSVVSGKSVSVRVDLGGRRIITTKSTHAPYNHNCYHFQETKRLSLA